MVFGAAAGFLKAVGRKPSGEGSSVVFHARTRRKLLDILTHRAACAAPLSFADYEEMKLHQCPDLTVLGLGPQKSDAPDVTEKNMSRATVDPSPLITTE